MRTPGILIVICYFLLIVTDILIILDFRKMSVYKAVRPLRKKRTGVWWKVYTVFAVLVVALLTVAVCMPKRAVHTGITPTMWMLYIVLTVLLAQSIYAACSLMGFIPSLFRARRWNTGLWVGMPLGVLVFFMMWWGVLIGRYRIQTVEVQVESPRLPASFDGYRIAQISDLHVGTWNGDTVFISRLVDAVNALRPDLIVFTGDIVNRQSDELLPFIGPLSRLHAPDGVLTILGNHDYGDYVSWDSPSQQVADIDSLKAYQRRMGWRMLDNAHTAVRNAEGDSIIVIGVGNWGEPPFTQYGDLRKAVGSHEMLNDSNFKVLLSHNPEHWSREVSEISNIDLTLSGHTHAMQIMFTLGKHRWSPSQYRYDRWAGMYSRENRQGVPTHVYVNIGAGEVGIPMRIGATPEITLFVLRHDGETSAN